MSFAAAPPSTCQLRCENVEWVLFDPAGIRVDLLELVLGNTDDPAVMRKENGARTGGALIESENVFTRRSACLHASMRSI